MSKATYKYNINHQISLQPRHISIGTIESVLTKEHGISRTTFYRDRDTLIDDRFFIPSERLIVYAALLGCTVDDLKNFTSKKIKPLSERKLSKLQKSIVAKTKMVKGVAKFLVLAFLLSSCISYKGVGTCPSYNSTTMHRPR